MEFHGCELDLERGQLLRNGREVALEPRVFELLCHFAKHPERLITKDELMRDVWRVHSLSSGVMGNAVAKLRRALGQPPNASVPIETVHGRGYRFRPEILDEPSIDRVGLGSAVEADPFFGREPVLETLTRALDRARAGQGTVMVLAGSAGIGKTRTARELATRAAGVGFRVMTGAAYEGETRAPYWPFTEMLRQARHELGAEGFARHVSSSSGALSLVWSEFGVNASPPALDLAAARFQVCDEVARVFASLSDDTPLLVVFDDLHWADSAAIELFAFAARALERRRVVWIANLRDDELAASAPPSPALRVIDRIATRIVLPGLTRDAVARLSNALGGQAKDSQSLDALHARTGGNPFFVRQLIAAEGLHPRSGSQRMASDEVPGLPAAIRSVLSAKLARLDPDARMTAAAAAVIGVDFTLSILTSTVDASAEVVLEQLDALARAGVITQRTGTELFAFSHDLLREVLYAELSVRERGALHSRVAAWLERHPTRERVNELTAIAHHLLHALPAQLESAISACRLAARAAHEATGFEASARLLSRALVKLDAEHGDPQVRCELGLELGMSYFHAIDFERAWNAFREATDGALQFERTDLIAALVPHLVNCIDVVAGDAEYARRVIDQSLTRLPVAARAARAILLAHRAELASDLPSAERAAILDEADGCAAASGEPDAILEVVHSRSNLRDPTMLDANRAAADRLLMLIDQHREAADTIRYGLVRRLSAWITHYTAAATACDVERADHAFHAIEELARTSGVRPVALAAAFMRAGRELAAGRLDALAAIVQEGFSEQLEFASRANLVFGRFAFSLMHARGDVALLSTLDLDSVQVPNVTRRHATDMSIARAHAHAVCGRAERANAELAAIPRDLLARMPVLAGDLGLLCQLAETCCLIDNTPLGAMVYERLRPYAARNALFVHFEYWGAVAHYLGKLARQLGDTRVARDYFLQARAINRELGMPLQAAATERALESLSD